MPAPSAAASAEARVVFGIFQRMILGELVKVFLLALTALTGMFLIGGVVTEASQRGLTPAQILLVIPLIVPSTLPYTIPATTLFATCLVYGRLSHDNEILAIKSAGINLLRIVSPALMLGVVMSAVTMGLYYYLIPYSHQLLRTVLLRDMEELMYTILSTEHCLNHPKLNYAIWVQKVQGKRLVNPYFKRRNGQGFYDLIAHAREAELRIDTKNNQMLVHMRDGEVLYADGTATHAYFKDRFFEVPLPPSPFGGDKWHRPPRELTWQEIYERMAEIKEIQDSIAAEIALTTSRLMLANPPADLPQHLAQLKVKRFYIDRDMLALRAELQMRPAISLGCLCFVLAGCPVGIWLSRSDYLSAFITCFTPVVLIYYPLLLCGTNMATRHAWAHPAVTIWAADVVMAVISLVLFRYLLKH
ncbi:MAG: LptF/LptG family permease [Gemmataceae bacterium]|nr:LptF/LptG family permease [Gemmataceae bacterium]MDW8264747.1 LptF/LptG family permease [Gemmataceae bacterium]